VGPAVTRNIGAAPDVFTGRRGALPGSSDLFATVFRTEDTVEHSPWSASRTDDDEHVA
jgi:hypothetical protein